MIKKWIISLIHMISVLGPKDVDAATPLLLLISILGAILGAILLVGGIYLAVGGSLADTNFTLFGNELSSTSVGVSITFIGAVLIVITIRQVLLSLVRIAELPEKHKKRKK